jgi:hypothetical protein
MVSLALGLTCGFAVASCGTREDNTVGASFIEDEAELKAVRSLSIAPPDTSADFQLANPGGSPGSLGRVLIGADDFYVCRTLWRIDVSAFTDSSSVVDSAAFRLVHLEGWGDPATMALSLHRITSSWQESAASVDTLFPSFAPAADTVSFVVTTGGDVASIPLTEFVRTWVDTPDSNFGFTVQPLDGVRTIREFGSSESSDSPQLFVFRTDTVDTLTFQITEDSFFLAKRDAQSTLAGQPGRLTLARGIPARALLHFPPAELHSLLGPRATVNRATLTLFVDASLSRLTSVSVRAARVLDSEWSGESTEIESIYYGDAVLEAGADSVVIEIAGLVDKLYKEQNNGFEIRLAEELLDVDYVRFHAHDSADSARVPRLKIWYTPGDVPEGTP